MLRLATHNVNGIRAALRRGYLAWQRRADPDVIALQEMRCPLTQVPAEITDGEGYHLTYDPGTIAGRNGVALLTRSAPQAVRVGLGVEEFDAEGRYLEVDVAGLTVASLYLPKGGEPHSETHERYERKMRFCAALGDRLRVGVADAQQAGREFALMGDFNIGHTELDIKNWKGRRGREGFLEDERAWIDTMVTGEDAPLVDVVRSLHPDQPGPYSWWSWRGRGWDTDGGWRIDYHWTTPRLAAAAVEGGTQREPSYDERVSDHSPVVVDYDIDLEQP